MTTANKLKAGTKLRGDDGTIYEVEALLGQGGFGTTYLGHRLSVNGRRTRQVCLKVCKDRSDWHGEAFFGQLLNDNPRVVKLLDAFVASTGTGITQHRRHVLIFELMREGTVWDATKADWKPWTEAKVRKGDQGTAQGACNAAQRRSDAPRPQARQRVSARRGPSLG